MTRPLVSRPNLMERTAERAAIHASVLTACSGQGGTVLIEGAAGIGKSSLVEVARQDAGAAGMTVLGAIGSRLETTAFSLALELLGPLAMRQTSFDGPARFARHLFDPDVEHARYETSEDAVFATIHGLSWLIETAADDSPLALLVDDAQWADEPSLRLLEYLSRRIGGAPILLAVAVRHGDQPTTPAPLAQLQRESPARILRPAALSSHGVKNVVQQKLGEPAPEFVSACARASGGNPFYLDALLNEARLSGLGPGVESAREVAGLKPESIRRSLLARLERLGAGALACANAITAMGSTATLVDIAHVADLEPKDAATTLGDLEAAEILACAEPPAMKHPLVAEAIRDAIGSAELRELHLRCAQALHSRNAPADQIASQLVHARRSGEPWTWQALLQAARAARDRGAPSEAARLLKPALEERPPTDQRATIWVELGLAQAAAGDPDAIESLGRAVADLEDPESRAECCLALARVLAGYGRTEEALHALARGMNELGPIYEYPEAGLPRELEMRHALIAYYEPPLHVGAAQRMEAWMRSGQLGDSATSMVVRAHLAQERVFVGRVAEARQLATEVLSSSRFVGGSHVDHLELEGAGAAAVVLALADGYRDAVTHASSMLDRALAAGSVVGLAAASYKRALALSRQGSLDSAAADAEVAISGYEHGWRFGVDLCHATLARRALERGELDLAAAELARLPGKDEDWQMPTFADFLLVRSQLALMRGDPDAALADALACGRLHTEFGINYPIVPWRSQAALALARLDRLEDARALVADEMQMGKPAGHGRAYGVSLRTEAATTSPYNIDAARESVNVLARTEAELEHARSLVALGSALRRGGHRRDSRTPLKSGLVAARGCGALALAEHAGQELRASGGQVPKRPLAGVEALTPAELRVARLAADGASNPEIAASLFVSRRTIETHLTRIYDKLDCSRSDLADRLG